MRPITDSERDSLLALVSADFYGAAELAEQVGQITEVEASLCADPFAAVDPLTFALAWAPHSSWPASPCIKPCQASLVELVRTDGRPRVLNVNIDRTNGRLTGAPTQYWDAPRPELPNPRSSVVISWSSRTTQPWVQAQRSQVRPEAGEIWSFITPSENGFCIGTRSGKVRNYSLDGELLDVQQFPSATDAEAHRLSELERLLDHAMHELPRGVLMGMNGVDQEGALAIRDAAFELVALAEHLGRRDLVLQGQDMAWHAEHYEHYLSRRRHFNGYVDYCQRRQGSFTIRRWSI